MVTVPWLMAHQKKLWLPCCIRHDFTYWQGGSSNDRLIADNTLHQCVKKRR